MKTAIVSIIKNKTGDSSGKNNYRPIACSKIFEIFFWKCLNNIYTHIVY